MIDHYFMTLIILTITRKIAYNKSLDLEEPNFGFYL